MWRLLTGLCVAALAVPAALWAADANPAKVDPANKDDKPAIHSYEYQRDYVEYPTVNKDQKGYVPTIPDERNATRTNQFGDKYVEPMPTNMEARQDKQANWARKLGRGAGNLFLGWLEIPHQMDKSVRQTDPATGILIGVPRGVFFAVDRTLVGVFEIVTFPSPRPGNYDPIIRPEFLTAETWDEPMPVVSDAHNNFKTDPGKDW
jgi:putative exosortase-associated protein (TIGR04073 family)